MKGVAMKLYIYDHCPFCVRARMIFGLRDVAVDEETLLNDDEDTPIGLIGAKQVPILIKPTARRWERAWILCALLMNMRAKSA